jgi:hypothetical protein
LSAGSTNPRTLDCANSIAQLTNVEPRYFTAIYGPKLRNQVAHEGQVSWQQAMTSNNERTGERSAGWRRTVIQACFQQNIGHRWPSWGNAGIGGWSLQDAGLQHLRHPGDRVFRQTLPNLLRRRMFVQGFYRIGRRTLRRTIASSYAYGERRDRKDDNQGTPNPAPETFEICQMQHSRFTEPIYFLPYSSVRTQETRRNYRNCEDNSF